MYAVCNGLRKKRYEQLEWNPHHWDISKLGKAQRSAAAWDLGHDFHVESSSVLSLSLSHFPTYGQTLIVAHDLAKLSRLAA